MKRLPLVRRLSLVQRFAFHFGKGSRLLLSGHTIIKTDNELPVRFFYIVSAEERRYSPVFLNPLIAHWIDSDFHNPFGDQVRAKGKQNRRSCERSTPAQSQTNHSAHIRSYLGVDGQARENERHFAREVLS